MAAKATREAFGEALLALGKTHPEIVVLDADLSKSTKTDLFAKEIPERFFEMGIQEMNMIGVAAGLALSGKVPFVCSFACFVSGRFDQIKMAVSYSRAPVCIVGSHAGIGVGEDGYSQQGLEDLALMRSLPEMTVLENNAIGSVASAAVLRVRSTRRGVDVRAARDRGSAWRLARIPPIGRREER